MPARRLTSAAIACALALFAALALSACGEEEGEPKREGLAVDLDGVTYNVYITRQLNPADPEDRGYVQGINAPTGQALYGVFMQVCNESGDPKQAASEFKVTDTQGNEFEPLPLAPTNIFAYTGRRLAPDDCIPTPGSLAASGPTAGALLVFRLPLAATENRPLELEIAGPFDAVAAKRETIAIELDI